MPINRINSIMLGLGGLLLLIWAGCARQLVPLEADPALRGPDPFLAADLGALPGQLSGEPLRDRSRLELVEGREGDPLPCAGGWLLQVRRSLSGERPEQTRSQALLLWLDATLHEARVLARADSLRMLALRGSAGPVAEARILLLVRDGDERRVVEAALRGASRALWRAAADRLDYDPVSGELRVATEADARPFVEEPGSWHRESRASLLEHQQGWRVGGIRPVDSPYRALAEFLDACRRGRWGKARERADLSRLLALPEGGYSKELEESLRRGMPELTARRLQLRAPRRGALNRFETLAGDAAWRVELEPRGDAEGRRRWVVTRLERVLKP